MKQWLKIWKNKIEKKNIVVANNLAAAVVKICHLLKNGRH